MTLGDARDEITSDPRKVITKLHVPWAHPSARRLKRDLVDSHLANYVDEVLGDCEVCRAFDKDLRVRVAATSTVPMFDEKASSGCHGYVLRVLFACIRTAQKSPGVLGCLFVASVGRFWPTREHPDGRGM